MESFKQHITAGNSGLLQYRQTTCTIEISTKTFYKALHYHCPEHFTDNYNKRFMDIVDFLNPYIPFYFPICLPVK